MNNNTNNPIIITHPGKAHRDEFVAVALLMATVAENATVLRKEPSPAEMSDPDVFVVHVGGSFDPRMRNLDHHQEAREAPPRCSITCVIEYLRMDPEKAAQVWSWFQLTELLDSKGPIATTKVLEISQENFQKLGSPIEGYILRCFGSQSQIGPGTVMHQLLTDFGKELIQGYREIQERVESLKGTTKFEDVGGIQVADNTAVCRTQRPSLGFESFLKETTTDVAVVISQDDRGTGFSLFRRNDHPAIDFSRLEGDPEVTFAHKGGFIAKTAAGADWRRLVAKAVIA